MKKFLYILAACALLCACGTKPAQQAEQSCPYQEDSFPIHGSLLKNVDSMEYYSAKAQEGDARALYIMAASYCCTDQVQPLPFKITRVRTREVADSMLNVAAQQGYKPAIATQECFKKCRGEE